MYRTLATHLDKSWQCLGAGRVVVDDAIEIELPDPRGRPRRLAAEPSLMTVINSNSPLRLDGPMSDGLIEMALHGQAVVVTPFTLAGAMTPVTLAGALAQQNAEALFMVALAQLARPGAPVVYGGFTSNVDMRSGAPAFGTPEYVKAALATGQLARRHRLPWRSSNVTASNVVDAQAAYESEMSVWGALMGGVNLLYQGAGWLEGGLTASFEKLIVDAEILQMMAETLAVRQSTRRVSASTRSPRSDRAATTSARPTRWSATRPPSTGRSLSDWRNFETWQEDGARTATERANRIWKQLLAEYAPPALEPERRGGARRVRGATQAGDRGGLRRTCRRPPGWTERPALGLGRRGRSAQAPGGRYSARRLAILSTSEALRSCDVVTDAAPLAPTVRLPAAADSTSGRSAMRK